jgi:hypothetical protein
MDPQRKELPRPPVAPAVADEIVQARHGTRLAIQALGVLDAEIYVQLELYL